MKLLKINKVVNINNWLFTTNIYSALSDEQLDRMTTFLEKQFPDHLIMFRNLDLCTSSAKIEGLKKRGYRLIRSRHVMVYDPSQKSTFSPKVRYHHRRDRKLIEKEGYLIFREQELTKKDFPHLLALHRKVYHHYTKYSPDYTETFLEKGIQEQWLHVIGLKKQGEIHGVIGYFLREGVMTIPFFGYDSHQGQSNHLYRMLTALILEEAEKQKVLLNDGSGGEAHKSYRGLKAYPEYIAIYDQHLGSFRRMFWRIAQLIIRQVNF